MVKDQMLSPSYEDDATMSTCTTSVRHRTGGQAHSEARIRNGKHIDRNGRSKALLTNDMAICVENSQEYAGVATRTDK